MQAAQVMRLYATAVALVTLASCALVGAIDEDENDNPAPPDNNSETCAGASPAPYCGDGGCNCCGSCDPARELCFAAGWQIELGYGQCYSTPVGGSMTATIDGVAFAAGEVAAVASEGYVQINGRLVISRSATDFDAHQLTLQLPAQLGTFDCTGTSLAVFAYTEESRFGSETVDAWNQLRLMPRPTCVYTITAIGEVGERIEGTFAATLVDRKTGATVELTDGAFSVERVIFP